MLNLDEVVSTARDLVPMPASLARLVRVAGDEHSGLAEVTEIASLDQALTGALIRAANSAAYGGTRPIGTVRDAISRVGTAAMLSLAVGSRVRGELGRSLPHLHLAEGVLWRHSVTAALASEIVSRSTSGESPSGTFTAALTHDVGKLVLERFLEPDHMRWLREACQEGEDPIDAEVEILGVSHAEVGAAVLQSWNFPDELVKAVQFHHRPDEREDRLTDLVHAADVLAKRVEPTDERPAPEVAPGVWKRLGFDASKVEDLTTKIQDRLADVLATYDDA